MATPRSYTTSDLDLLRKMVEHEEPWNEISRRLGIPANTCKTLARRIGAARPTISVPVGDYADDSFRSRMSEERYVGRLMDEGGFKRAQKVDGQMKWLGPYEAAKLDRLEAQRA
jgi:hypothetical protein